jgi:hypothetical protein
VQLLISLFTTGGKINPIAILIFVFTALYGYDELKDWANERRIIADAKIVQDASQTKIDKLNEARNEQAEANTAINNGSFNDWLDRVQRED